MHGDLVAMGVDDHSDDPGAATAGGTLSEPEVRSSSPSPRGTFHEHASSVLGNLQSAVLDLLRSVSASTKRASDVEKAFGVDYKLGWQIHRIATVRNPLEAGAHVPARVSMERLLKSATKRKASARAVERVSRAFDAFEHLVETEAGDRAELDAMIAEFVPEIREKRDLAARMASFKGISQVRGVAMEAHVGAFILHPSKDGATVDRATFSAYLGLRRLRSGSTIGFSTAGVAGAKVVTLDGKPTDGPYGILLPQFCSAPTPRFDVRKNGEITDYFVAGDDVGLSTAVDLVMAEFRPGAMKRYRLPGGRPMTGVMNLIDTPLKRMTIDVVLHKDIYPGGTPALAAYDTIPRGQVAQGIGDPTRERDRLALHEEIRPIPGGLSGATLPGTANYTKMLEHVCATLRWDPREFRVYRLEVDYPLYGSQFLIGFTLPDAPAAG